ncbi:MAG: hypothetical protein ACE14L_10475 [Terriglobales bacterium]
MVTRHRVFVSVVCALLGLAVIPFAAVCQQPSKPDRSAGRGSNPAFILKKPASGYLERLRAARASKEDYFWREIESAPGDPTFDAVKDLLAPIRYVNAPWRYAGVILSAKGSTQKFRVIENGFQIDANLTRRSPLNNKAWAVGDTHLWVMVGPNDELFGLDENRQGTPAYEDGHLPVFRVEYTADGVVYEETVLVHQMIADYRSPFIDEPGMAAYIRITAKTGPGSVAFELQAPPAGYGFPIAPGGFRGDRWTDEHNNVFAWFSPGGTFDFEKNIVRFRLKKGESVYVVMPHERQMAGTQVRANRQHFEQARASVIANWKKELASGAQVKVPEKLVEDAYRSLLIGNWQVTVGDELPYGMFSYYQGNGYAEALQTIAPFIEYGYFAEARRFIQPILEYPLSDTGVGLHVAANRLELASYYYALSGDAEFIRKNKNRLVEVADYLLARRDAKTGLLMDGYGFDLADRRVVNINTNTNGWRALRNLGLTLQAVGDPAPGKKYLDTAATFGALVRKAVLDNIDQSTNPPFVPFALGAEKPHRSLIGTTAASYYNIVMPYFFESEIFPPNSDPYTYALEYMWTHQGVMAGINRFAKESEIDYQDGIHPLYTWGRQFAQISRHETKRALYTFYSALANGYTRGTFLTGENQTTVPSENEWFRGTYLPPEPPANALLLRSLRHMLLHEHDHQQDGVYDELWLLSSAPAAWIEPGKTLSLDKMPSRFGAVSLTLTAATDGHRIDGQISLDAGSTGKDILLFVRGQNVTKATLSNGVALRVSRMDKDAVIHLPSGAGRHSFRIDVARK